MRGRKLTKAEETEKNERLKRQGARLKNLRENSGLSQDGLAKKIKVSTGLVKQIEIGLRNLTQEKLLACAETFGVWPEYITGEIDYKDRADELAAKLSIDGLVEADLTPEEERILRERWTDAWRAAERLIQAAFPGESLANLEKQGRINLFEIYDGISCLLRDRILLAKLPAHVRDMIDQGKLSLDDVKYRSLYPE